MIETTYHKIEVTTGKEEVCLRIEDKEEIFGYLNLCWMKEKEVERLIGYLQDAKRKLEESRLRIEKIINTTDFDKMYNDFEKRYNRYPVQMSRAEAFGHALNEGLIDEDTYEAAAKVYKRLWNYVGD